MEIWPRGDSKMVTNETVEAQAAGSWFNVPKPDVHILVVQYIKTFH